MYFNFKPRLLFFDWLDSVAQFFSDVWDVITGAVEFLWSIIENTWTLMKMIPDAVSSLTDAIDSLPEILVVFATTTITVVTVFMILGRSHGGSE